MRVNTLFQAHRLPLFWIILIAFHHAIMVTAALDNIWFPTAGFIAWVPIALWVEDVEAGRHNVWKKNIITLLIALSCLAMCTGYVNSSDIRTRVDVVFSIMLVIQIIFLIATIWDRKVNKRY